MSDYFSDFFLLSFRGDLDGVPSLLVIMTIEFIVAAVIRYSCLAHASL